MLLGMQDFDFCPNRIKFYQILPNLSRFAQILSKFAQIFPQIALNFAQICLKNLLEDAAASSAPTQLRTQHLGTWEKQLLYYRAGGKTRI